LEAFFETIKAANTKH